jgi:hypothetical protein
MKTVNRLSMKQSYELIDHLKSNEGAYRGMTYQEITKVLSGSLEFEISESTLKRVSKQFKINLGARKLRSATNRELEERVEVLEDKFNTLLERLGEI